METFFRDAGNESANVSANSEIRRALNYALWVFENQKKVQTVFVEKASKCVFSILPIIRNTRVEMQGIFIYWVLHEMIFHTAQCDEIRIQAAKDNIYRIAKHYNIEIPRSDHSNIENFVAIP